MFKAAHQELARDIGDNLLPDLSFPNWVCPGSEGVNGPSNAEKRVGEIIELLRKLRSWRTWNACAGIEKQEENRKNAVNNSLTESMSSLSCRMTSNNCFLRLMELEATEEDVSTWLGRLVRPLSAPGSISWKSLTCDDGACWMSRWKSIKYDCDCADCTYLKFKHSIPFIQYHVFWGACDDVPKTKLDNSVRNNQRMKIHGLVKCDCEWSRLTAIWRWG